jgi:hypothetical protein
MIVSGALSVGAVGNVSDTVYRGLLQDQNSWALTLMFHSTVLSAWQNVISRRS